MLTTRAAMPSRLERLVHRDAELHFAAAGDQDHVRLAAFGIGHHIGAARESGGRRVTAAVENRQLLPAENEAGRLVAQPHDDFIRFDHLVGIGRPQQKSGWEWRARPPAARSLMGRSILASPIESWVKT